jgi:hypothetical protein
VVDLNDNKDPLVNSLARGLTKNCYVINNENFRVLYVEYFLIIGEFNYYIASCCFSYICFNHQYMLLRSVCTDFFFVYRIQHLHHLENTHRFFSYIIITSSSALTLRVSKALPQKKRSIRKGVLTKLTQSF